MAISVNSATTVQTQPAAQSTAARQPAPVTTPQQAPAPSRAQPPATDTVQISAAALALHEATETSAQTSKEAGSGDVQAQRLLAREAAAHAVTK